MSRQPFARYVLRTTDVAAAAVFYDAVLGRHADGVVPLPAQAVSRGARPHWLGLVDVGAQRDPDEVATQFAARGAVRLGPDQPSSLVILRDPGGAVVGLGQGLVASHAGVIWHLLSSREAEANIGHYEQLFGWVRTARITVPGHGAYQQFAFEPEGESAGSITDIANHAELHPHWLFFFAVPSLDAAIAQVRGHGGTARLPVTLPDGRAISVCEDGQGAAFGLMA